MLRRLPVALCLVVIAGLSAPSVGADGVVAVDAAVQVTATPSTVRAHASPVIAVDPRDPSTVVVAEGEARSSTCNLHVSRNGGLSWAPAASPLPEGVTRCIRNNNGPIVAPVFLDDGTLLYAFAGFPSADSLHSKIYVSRSTDLGQTFTTTEIPGLDPPYPDDMFGSPNLPTIGVDPEHPDRVYVAYQANYGLFSLQPGAFPKGKNQGSYPLRAYVARSDDGGRTFSDPVPVSTDDEDSATRAYVVVGPDDTVHVFAGEVTTPQPFGSDNPPAAPKLYLATSTDGGMTFTQQVIYTSPQPPAGTEWGVLLGIAGGVDLDSGDLYVTWEDTGVRPPAVLFMRSGDGGATWSEPVQINDVEPQRQWEFSEMDPMLDVAPDGRIDVAWFDWRDDPAFTDGPDAENGYQNVYLSSSTDGGSTWSKNVRVTDRAIDRRLSDVWSTGLHSRPGLVSLQQGAYVAWEDTRNAVGDSASQDIYFTRVRMELTAGGGGSLVSSTSSSGTAPKVVWGVGGAVIGLGLAGGLLLLSRRTLSG